MSPATPYKLCVTIVSVREVFISFPLVTFWTSPEWLYFYMYVGRNISPEGVHKYRRRDNIKLALTDILPRSSHKVAVDLEMSTYIFLLGENLEILKVDGENLVKMEVNWCF